MIKKILALIAVGMFMVVGCSNSQISSDKGNAEEKTDITDDEKTGNLVSGVYSFTDYNQLTNFYKIFREKNTERFVIPNFDDLQKPYYNFECGGIDSEIISNETYCYDFPTPTFQIEINDYYIKLFDISSFINELKNINEIKTVDNKDNLKIKDIYANEYLIASITYNSNLSTDEIQEISNKFMEEIKNAF